MKEKLLEAVKAARECKKRNFKQSFDLAVNLRNVDLKKPENRIKTEAILPHPVKKEVKIGFFADMLVPQVKKYSELMLIKKEDIEDYAKNKRSAKRLAKICHTFLAEAPLMPIVAKALGRVLAVRGKMPKPVPPTVKDLKPLIERTKSSVRLTVKDSPVIHCRIGTEDMKDEELAENAEAVIKAIISALPKGKEQIKDVYLKLTMGKSVKVQI